MKSINRLHIIAGLLLATLSATAATAQQALPTRDEIPAKYRWDLSMIYFGLDEWEADYESAEKRVAGLEQARDRTIDTSKTLLSDLALCNDTRWLIDKLLVYAYQLSDQDTRDQDALALKGRATSLLTRFEAASAWLEPTLQQIPREQFDEWLPQYPLLAEYTHFIDDVLRQKEHTLPPAQEALLAMTGNLAQSPDAIYNSLRNAEMTRETIRDADGQEITLSGARFDKLIRSPDRRVRRDAFLGTMTSYHNFQNTFAATLAAAVQRDNFLAQARGFDHPLQTTLFPDNLPDAVYANLVETVKDNLPLLHRWAELRKQILDVDELHVWDLYCPLITGTDEEIPYDDAVESIIAALEPLGDGYVRVLRAGFERRWIDVYETQGKRAGGYSWGSYDTPPYILINYNGTRRDVSVIAHEMGHSLHSHFTHQNQPKVYGQYSYFIAEIPAILNEILLEEYLLKTATSDRERLRLLNEQIDNLRGTFFRQVMFAEFEYAIHDVALRGKPLTAERMGNLYLDTFQRYWGPQLVRDEEGAPYWARIPHFYMNHYVYRYATSYCAAATLAERILTNEPGVLDRYIKLLKAGSSDYPLDLLRAAGVDMTSPQPIEATMRRFERLIDEFETLRVKLATSSTAPADTLSTR